VNDLIEQLKNAVDQRYYGYYCKFAIEFDYGNQRWRVGYQELDEGRWGWADDWLVPGGNVVEDEELMGALDRLWRNVQGR
jgi:hypothetical protein